MVLETSFLKKRENDVTSLNVITICSFERFLNWSQEKRKGLRNVLKH